MKFLDLEESHIVSMMFKILANDNGNRLKVARDILQLLAFEHFPVPWSILH